MWPKSCAAVGCGDQLWRTATPFDRPLSRSLSFSVGASRHGLYSRAQASVSSFRERARNTPPTILNRK
eukprot:scaffold27136_cov118-Isochrysis_galbana.AAC.1